MNVEVTVYQSRKVIARKEFASKADAAKWILEQNFRNDQEILIRELESCVVSVGTQSFGDYEYDE